MSSDTAIAIIGRAARVPGANNVEELWDNLEKGVESLTQLSDAELEAAGVPASERDADNYVKAGMFLSNVEMFDPSFFGFNPLDASVLDPQHRHFLEVAWEALEDAAYAPERFDGSIGVFAGCGHSLYLTRHLLADPKLAEEVGFFLLRHTGNDKDFLATRLSYLFDLDGPSINVQTACSTSLVATHLGCQSLLNGECDMVLAGGVSIGLPPRRGYAFREGEILAVDGHCRPFDAAATGTLFGSGLGAVVLRRLEDALEAGDNIHAVVLGSAVNNDGAAKVSYLAPSVDGQTACVNEALNLADVPVETINYVECHGTGTALGDPIEIAALNAAFSAITDKRQFCGVGSVKSNIGHLDTAAGVISLIKVIEALKHRKVPPSLHYKTSNPEIDFPSTPFFVNAELSEWKGEVRRAGVNSLGVGGTNAFVILEQAPRETSTSATRQHQLLTLSAVSAQALNDATDRLATHLRANPEVNLADVAHTLQSGRAAFEHRRVLACRDAADAVEGLLARSDTRAVTQKAPKRERTVAFMFAGGGAQYPNMGRDLYDGEPVYRAAVDRCLGVLSPKIDYDLKALMYPTAGGEEQAALELRRPTRSLTSLVTTQYALAQLWLSWGIEPTALMGHSVGENTAACIAGVLSLEDTMSLIVLRGQLFEQVPEGGMVSVALAADELRKILPSTLDIALINATDSSVASGPVAALEELERALAERGVDFTRIRINIAAHSSMLEPILDPFGEFLKGLTYHAPKIPLVSNVSGNWMTDAQACDAQYWVDHLRSTVRFTDCAGKLLADANRVLLEVGPGRTLTSLASMHPSKTAEHAIMTSLGPRDEPGSDVAHLLTVLGRLWQNNVPIDWSLVHGDDKRRRISLPTYPWQHTRHWVDAGHMTATAGDLDPRENVDDWLYAPSWKPSRHPDAGDVSARRYLVLQQEHAVTNPLITALRERAQEVVVAVRGADYAQFGEGAFMVRPSSAEDYQELFRTLADRPVDEIVHLWNLDDGSRESSFDSLFALAQAIANEDISSSMRLTVVSSGAQQVAAEPLVPIKALLLGPCGVIPTEIPNVTCRSVDIGETTPEQLLAELTGEVTDDVVAYRGERRFRRVFAPASLEDTEARAVVEGGVYLITGGLGGLGLHAAETIAGMAATKLVLMSRSAPTPEQQKKIVAIEALGSDVMVVAADVANLAQVTAAVASINDRFGAIHGVVHTAGVLAEEVIQLKQNVDEVLAAKVDGTLALQKALSSQPIEFWVLYSSVSAFAGLPGQVDYAAANAFIDAFAHATPKAVSINWTAWQQIGMAANLASGTVGRVVAHPLLGRCVEETEGRVAFEVDLAVAEHWVLSEHRLRDGHCLLPGSGYVEIARAAFAERYGEGAVELTDVFFMVPCFVTDDQHKRVRVSLDDDEFVIESGDEHTRGCIRRIDELPSKTVALEEVIERCSETVQFEDTMRHPTLDFGSRWRCLRTLHIGEHEAVAQLELAAEHLQDREHYKFHPAMVDMATAGAQGLIEGYDPKKDFYVPVGYTRFRAQKEVPAKAFSHIRYRSNPEGKHAHDVAIFDVTVTDEGGQVIAEIEEFTMKRIDSFDQVVALQQQQATAPVTSANAMVERALELGIHPTEGAQALQTILTRAAFPQVAVATRPLHALLAELGTRPEPQQAGSSMDEDPVLAEIDAVLRAHPAIREAVVRAYPAGAKQRRLVAHVVYEERQRATVSELRKYVRKELSDDLVPQHVVDYDVLPEERSELADPLAAVDDYVAPRTDVEKLVARIWQDVLGIDRVGIYDNFFDAGGHSLLSIRAITKIHKATGVKLNQAIMVLRTLEQVAREVAERTP